MEPSDESTGEQRADLDAAVEDAPTKQPCCGQQIGDAVFKLLSDTAYAAAGAAVTLVEHAQGYCREQREQAEQAGDERSPQYLAFVELPDQIQRFVSELTKGYQDLIEKGRERVHKAQSDLESEEAKKG